jgi:CBS domain-containing protein
MIDRPISEFMASDLVTFSPDMPINQALNILAKNKYSGAPVVNDKKELVGVLSEKDCLATVVDSYYNQRPLGTGTVSDYMSKEVKFISPDKTVIEVAYQFVHSSFKRFPVVKDGKLVGQISRSDILKVVSQITPEVKIVPDTWKARMPNP